MKNYLILLVIVVFLTSCSAFKVIKLLSSGEVVATNYTKSVVPILMEGHPILIKARLNNSQKNYNFVFDTGAFTLIKQEVAKELDLPKGIDIEASCTGGKSKTIGIVKLDNIIVGNMEVRDCAVGVTDFSGMFSPDISGILGSNFFKYFNLTIDYRNKEVTLSREDYRPTESDKEIVLPFDSKMEMGFAPTIDCMVDEEIKSTAIIDTGYPGIVAVPLSMIKKTNSFKKGKVVTGKGSMMGGMFGVSDQDYSLRIDELKIGELKLKNIPATSHSSKKDHLLLGGKFFEKYLVTLNYPSKKMILTPYGTPFEKNIPSYGLALVKENHNTLVSGIWSNSSASRSGINLGDEVVKINAMETNTLSLSELMTLFLDEKINSLKVEYINDKGKT